MHNLTVSAYDLSARLRALCECTQLQRTTAQVNDLRKGWLGANPINTNPTLHASPGTTDVGKEASDEVTVKEV